MAQHTVVYIVPIEAPHLDLKSSSLSSPDSPGHAFSLHVIQEGERVIYRAGVKTILDIAMVCGPSRGHSI